jgi:hypothetical protein
VVSATPTGTGLPTPAGGLAPFGLSGPTLPAFSGLPFTASPGGNVGPLFPSISASGQAGSTGLAAGSQAGDGAPAPVAAVGPLGRQLLGTQLLGLAALFAAIGIVIARFTLRTPRLALAGARGAARKAANGVAAASTGKNAAASNPATATSAPAVPADTPPAGDAAQGPTGGPAGE